MAIKIDWKNLTKNEAEEILNRIIEKFIVFAKTEHNEGIDEVIYLDVEGIKNSNTYFMTQMSQEEFQERMKDTEPQSYQFNKINENKKNP